MSLSAKLRRAPERLVTGAFVLNSGLGKLRNTNEETAAALHGMASNAYPAFKKVDPKTFVKALGAGETALGAALLLPIVPAGLAGLGLIAFSGGLLGLYFNTPGLRQADGIRPTPQGNAMAKDVWMLGIGAGLVLDAILAESKVTNDDHHLVG